MIKHCAFLAARRDMARDDFIHRYEQGHVPLISKVVPLFEEYRRSFLIKNAASNPDHVSSAPRNMPFDVVTELWFRDESRIAEMGRLVHETDAGERIAEDEKDLFDRRRMRMCEVDERVTAANLLAPRPDGYQGAPAIKLLCFLSRKPGTTIEAFVGHYETTHTALALRALRHEGRPLFGGYSRSYVRPERSFAVGEPGANPPPLDFDVMTAIWFWTDEDHRRFLAQCGEPATAAQLAEDEARFMDRDKVSVFHADEFVTRMTSRA